MDCGQNSFKGKYGFNRKPNNASVHTDKTKTAV